MRRSRTFAYVLVGIFALAVVIYFVNPLRTASMDPRARLWGVAPFRIYNYSMEPSVSYGSVILVCTGSFRFSAPHVGDIIAFQYPPDPSSIWIKRIIAVGPQKLAIRDGRVVLDGRVLAEPYLNGRRPRTEISTTLPEVLVPAGSLFVMGDNRDNSLDSRQWGFVPVSALVGRVCGGLNG